MGDISANPHAHVKHCVTANVAIQYLPDSLAVSDMTKIENVKVSAFNNRGSRREFLEALPNLKVGQSFIWDLGSNDRTAISIAQFFLDRQFVTRKEGHQFRIGRTT